MLPQKAGRLSLDSRDRRFLNQANGALVVFALFIASFGASFFLTQELTAIHQIGIFPYVLIALVFGSIYTVLSFRNLLFPFVMVILSIGGFRFLWSIEAPILPDLYFDRIMLMWLGLVFMVKFFAEGRNPRKPYFLDLLILTHGMFILIRIWMFGMENFHPWSMSIMVPYLVYFFAKNIVTDMRSIRFLLLGLLVLGFYYSVTSIGEKFDLPWLLYPRSMILEHEEFVGRSCGPFRNSGIFGNTLAMILPLNLYFLSTVQNRWFRIALFGNILLGIVGLYFTYTRGAWMVGAIALGVAVFFNRKEYLRIFFPVLVALPFLAFLVLGLKQDTFLKERVENDDTIDARVGTMVTAFRIWRDHPFLGCGPYRYIEVRENYIEPVKVPGLGVIKFARFRHNGAHDQYFSPLAEDGMVGTGIQFSIYFIILKTLLAKLRGRNRNDQFATFIVPLFLGILFAYLFGGVTQSFRHTSIMGTMLYMAAGIAYGYSSEEDKTKDTFA